MENRIQKLEAEIVAIKDRNLRVESDKDWETSVCRIGFLALLTFVVASLLLFLIRAENYFLGALIPTAGFLLSVQTLPVVKRWWVKHL